jgi:DNA-binding transcriptional LysR family regulator
VQIDLTLTDRFVDIVDEGYDAAIRLGALNDSTLVARAQAYRFVVCASPAYLAAAGAPETPHALIGHECLGFAYTSAPPAALGFIENGQAWTAPIAPRLRANDMKALITAAVNGLGIALAPETAVRDALRDGSLVPLLTQYEPVARLATIVMASSPTTLKLRYFVEEVVAAFGA